MTTPEGGQANQPPTYDDAMMWYDPDVAARTPDTDSPFEEISVSEHNVTDIPPKPDHEPVVSASEEPAAEPAPETKGRRFIPRSKAGKVAAGLLLSGVVVSGVGALIANHGEGQVSEAARYVMSHPNMSPEDHVKYGIPSEQASTEISVGTSLEEGGAAAAVGGLVLGGLVGTGRGFKAVGTWRSNRKAEKANRPEGETRAQRRRAKALAKARALVEAADGEASDN